MSPTPGTWPASRFTPATYSGGYFTPGELSPEEIVQHEVSRRLAADSKLAALFGDRIYAVPSLRGNDGGAGERLLVALAGYDVQERVTVLDYNSLTIYIASRSELLLQSRVMPYGEAGKPTVLAYIRSVLNKHDVSGVNNKMLPVTLANSAVAALVTESNPGAIGFSEQPVDQAGTQWVGDAIQPWVYRIKVNHDTGHIQSLDDSGAYTP